MTTRTTIASRSAWLGKDFGEQLARRYFGDETIDQLPRYVRGKNAGKLKAEIEWIKVENGGWVRTSAATANGEAGGFVENRSGTVVAARLVQREWGTNEIVAKYAEWSSGDSRDQHHIWLAWANGQ
jgi:hypothetical protein